MNFFRRMLHAPPISLSLIQRTRQHLVKKSTKYEAAPVLFSPASYYVLFLRIIRMVPEEFSCNAAQDRFVLVIFVDLAGRDVHSVFLLLDDSVRSFLLRVSTFNLRARRLEYVTFTFLLPPTLFLLSRLPFPLTYIST